MIHLLHDRVAVIADEVVTTTPSGLHIPEDSSAQEILRYGKVAIVGTGRVSESGQRVPIDVTVGQRVFWHKFSGQPLTFDGQEYIFLGSGDIIGVDDEQTGTVTNINRGNDG